MLKNRLPFRQAEKCVIIVKPDDIDDAGTALIARDICKKIEHDLDYPGQIKVNVIRETRSVDYAK